MKTKKEEELKIKEKYKSEVVTSNRKNNADLNDRELCFNEGDNLK